MLYFNESYILTGSIRIALTESSDQAHSFLLDLQLIYLKVCNEITYCNVQSLSSTSIKSPE